MLSLHSRRAAGALLFAGMLALAGGCGPNYKARATVKGKVFFGGKTLTAGTVMFYGKDNLTSSASITPEGEYVMKDAPVGDVTITVNVPPPPPGGVGMMKTGPAFESVARDGESKDPGGSGRVISIMGAMPSTVVPIPTKYANPETSGLTYKVERGEHDYNIDLKP